MVPSVTDTKYARYVGFWRDFIPDAWILHGEFAKRGRRLGRKVNVLGPFLPKPFSTSVPYVRFLGRMLAAQRDFDFFVTHENRPFIPNMANYHIGFWTNEDSHRVHRFPYWMALLDFDEEVSTSPRGDFLRAHDLVSSSGARVGESFHSRRNRAVIVTRHLIEPRKSLFKWVDEVIGCDGYGPAFNRPVPSKDHLLRQYQFNLCPENSDGDGYVTEKVPQAVAAGCVPITWANPSAVKLDFNPDAMVNLYGLDAHEARKALLQLTTSAAKIDSIRQSTLLRTLPTLSGVRTFIANAELKRA